jgi:hypothetical protein
MLRLLEQRLVDDGLVPMLRAATVLWRCDAAASTENASAECRCSS